MIGSCVSGRAGTLNADIIYRERVTLLFHLRTHTDTRQHEDTHEHRSPDNTTTLVTPLAGEIPGTLGHRVERGVMWVFPLHTAWKYESVSYQVYDPIPVPRHTMLHP